MPLKNVNINSMKEAKTHYKNIHIARSRSLVCETTVTTSPHCDHVAFDIGLFRLMFRERDQQMQMTKTMQMSFSRISDT